MRILIRCRHHEPVCVVKKSLPVRTSYADLAIAWIKRNATPKLTVDYHVQPLGLALMLPERQTEALLLVNGRLSSAISIRRPLRSYQSSLVIRNGP